MTDTLRPLPDTRRHLAPVLIVIPILASIFIGIYLWRVARLAPASAEHVRPPVEVSALTIEPEPLPQSLEATGSLQAVNELMLAPEVAGRVVAIRFEAGMTVEAGTPLVELYDAPERAQRADAISRAQFARLQLDRARRLVATNSATQQLLDQRVTELEQADAAVQRIEALIAQKTISAPFAGVLGIRRVNLGQYVNPGDVLATLTALDRLYANFTLPQQQLSKLDLGGEVTVRTDAYPGQDFAARINAIEPMVQQDTRNVRVQATLGNPDRKLRPGLYVTVRIAQPLRPSAILVPATAIQTSASGDSILVVRDGKAAPVPVTTGQRVGDRIVVETGLGGGDVVITSGQLRVQPGAPVSVAASAAASRP
ncbi:efflux RND transporter periplasmic adaptor subunit [Rubrivivax sp. JA1024]|nr:efflux RND transporter periplasmic adaptor subunit [Rubrivivax sp. JA1024]